MAEKYEFVHGRDWLAGLYGAALSGVLVFVLLGAALLAEHLLMSGGVIDDYLLPDTAFLIIIGASFFIGIFSMYIFPLKNVNIKSHGILYDEYVEIHIGEKVKTIYYKEISFIKRMQRRGSMTWDIDTLIIGEEVGMRAKTQETRAQVDAFVNAVDARRNALS